MYVIRRKRDLLKFSNKSIPVCLVQRIIEELKSNHAISQKEIAEIGGKRYGHWQIMK